MVKIVFNKLNSFNPVVLVIIGWLAFVLGMIVESISFKLVLLSAARVLP